MARPPLARSSVTNQIEDGYVSADAIPPPSRDLLEFLERAFPPTCYTGQTSIEEHLLYAGKVQLIEALRWSFENQEKQAALSLTEPGPEDLHVSVR